MFTEDTYLLPNWDADLELETETFIQQHTYDAMNRSFLQKTGRLGLPLSTIIHGYDRGGLLYTVQCEAAEKGAKNAVTGISYNEKAQRVGITYGNGSSTAYSYEKDTFRLTRLVTLGMAGKVQDLNYAYDPVGNIARIENEAQDTIFFNNQSVAPSNDYEYDALYRLQRATGREHIGQAGVHANSPDDRTDVFRTNLPHPGDGGALQNYRQYYEYDAVGNMRFVRHLAGLGNLTNRWTKTFAYNNNGTDRNALGVDPATVHSNRLLQYQVGTDLQQFSFDAHGNMMALLPNSGNGQFNTAWDCFDRLGFIQLSNQGTAHYIYDGPGQRSQKIRTDGNRIVKERIYLGSFEIYREFNSDGSVKLERESLLVKDGSRQVALLETKTVDHPSDDSPEQLVRFQYGNHLGSTALELDWAGTIISYEEYYPYGATSYQAMDQTVKAVAKRYRYTGMERDEESGLNYHSARYYLPWLCRWASADPIGIEAGINLYRYSRNNPINYTDTNGKQEVPSEYYPDPMYQMARGFGAVFEFFVGGRADPGRDEKPELPKGGIGGVMGGVADTVTLRATDILEDNPTNMSKAGMEAGAAHVPFLDPSLRLVSGVTVTGKPTSRAMALLEVGLEVLPLIDVPLRSSQFKGASRTTRVDLPDTSIMLRKTAGASPKRTHFTSGTRASTGPEVSKEKIIQQLKDAKHTDTSKEVLDALENGSLKLNLDPGLKTSGKTSSPDAITVNNAMHMDDVLNTVVHEGRHSLDMAEGVIPLPGNASKSEHAFAELRAFSAESEFAVTNGLSNSSAYKRSVMDPRALAVSIADSYESLKGITDAELTRALSRFLNF